MDEPRPELRRDAGISAAVGRVQERKHSAEGLTLELKDTRRAGRAYLKSRPKKVIIEMTPKEIEVLERYGRRG